MEKLLHSEQEKFKAVFQNASLGILMINQSGIITLVNDFMLAQFGYSNAKELIGKEMEMLIPKKFHQQHVIDRGGFMEDPQTRPMGMGRDLFGVKKDGSEIPLEISLSSYTCEEGTFSIAFISDISQRIEAQNKLKEHRLELAAIQQKASSPFSTMAVPCRACC